MYMANVSPNARGPNANYITLGRIRSARLDIGSARLGIGFKDTNMLVPPTQNGRIGGLNQLDGPARVVCSGI